MRRRTQPSTPSAHPEGGLPLGSIDRGPRLPLKAKVRLAREILTTYARVRWLVRREELPVAVATLRAEATTGGADSGDVVPPINRWRLATSVGRVLALLPTDSRCLMRSLVLLTCLARRGERSTLVIGAKTHPKFAAHAWIEREGRPLLPDGGGEYPPLTAI